MGNKLFDQLGGTIKVRLRGKNQERAINMASTRGIFIWDIKKKGDDLDMKVRTSGFKALKSIAEENDFELEVTEKQGLPFFKNVIRRRMAFIGGGFLFLIAMYLLSSFVWSVEVTGNKQVEANRIIVAAARHGIYPGAAKWTFSRSEAENAILKEVNDICYVQINVKGVKARIKVVEKIVPLKDIDGPGNIVAKKDGLVEEVLVLDGQARVKEGDVVAKGDILISGVVVPEPNPFFSEEEQVGLDEPTLVKARGQVKAKVWYEGYGECSLKTENIYPGSGKQRKLYLVTPWGNVALNIGKVRFSYYDQSTRFNVLNTRWGDLGFKHVLIREKIKKVQVYNEKQAFSKAKQAAMENLHRKISPGSRITKSQVKLISSPSEPIIRVKATAETSENIALTQPINTEAK